MQKTAQDSQQKSENLGNGEAVYAFKIARINPENLSVKFWTLGGNVRRFNLACSEVSALVEQIDSAIADGDFCLWFDGARFAIPEKLMRGIRAQFSSYAVQGGSDANVVRGGVSTPTKPKASARQGNVSAARQNLISQKDTCADSDVELDNSAHTAQVSADFVNQVAQIVGEELRKAVMPVLAEIDAITALVKECAAELAAISKQFITRAPGEFGGQATPPAPRRKGGRDSYCPKAGRVNAEGSIFTRRGRTSVVVGRRKVS